MKREIILVTGGCRSGKSAFALQLALERPAGSRIYLATCLPRDAEMEERVARHQKERDASWLTLEVPVELPRAIETHAHGEQVLLVDCLTLWLTNLLLACPEGDNVMPAKVDELIPALNRAKCPVILVTNEVGAGIVPENKLARRFRDLTGITHQKVAAAADQVYLVVAGIPLRLKG